MTTGRWPCRFRRCLLRESGCESRHTAASEFMVTRQTRCAASGSRGRIPSGDAGNGRSLEIDAWQPLRQDDYCLHMRGFSFPETLLPPASCAHSHHAGVKVHQSPRLWATPSW